MQKRGCEFFSRKPHPGVSHFRAGACGHQLLFWRNNPVFPRRCLFLFRCGNGWSSASASARGLQDGLQLRVARDLPCGVCDGFRASFAGGCGVSRERSDEVFFVDCNGDVHWSEVFASSFSYSWTAVMNAEYFRSPSAPAISMKASRRRVVRRS